MALASVLVMVKRAVGAALLVPMWPSRRMIRRLQDENAELRENHREVDAFLATAAGACERLAYSARRSRNTL